jgi:phosphate/sulfate permease
MEVHNFKKELSMNLKIDPGLTLDLFRIFIVSPIAAFFITMCFFKILEELGHKYEKVIKLKCYSYFLSIIIVLAAALQRYY